MKIRSFNLFILLMVSVFLLMFACSGDRAEELFKTAQFEELQNNREHARQLYQEILKKFPESEYAGKARDRLADSAK
ncbi:MAG: hypothetical protein AB1499_11990 [Nitrospirota bacterium]